MIDQMSFQFHTQTPPHGTQSLKKAFMRVNTKSNRGVREYTL